MRERSGSSRVVIAMSGGADVRLALAVLILG